MTDRFILIGHPVGHSLSPVIHGAAYRALGRDGHYGLVDCPTEESVLAQVEEVRSGRLTGANVTVPWKKVAFETADERHQTAQDVGVANVLARTKKGKVIAYNTDASALARELSGAVKESKVSATERPRALILGTGGASLAAAVSCRLAGVGEIGVTGRRCVGGDRGLWPNREKFDELGVTLIPWLTENSDETANFLNASHLLVQGTSAGMKGTEGGEALAELVPFEKLSRLVAYDLVYTPRVTPFLKRAAELGHFAQGGLGMLVGQAAQAIGIWWGEEPPLEPLAEAAEKALGL